MYDKVSRQFCQASVATVAQQANYYSPDVERALTEVVESPGNNALEKLIRRETLDNAERSHVSLYLLTMATRGPRQRRKAMSYVPEALDSVVEGIRKQVESWIQERKVDSQLAHARLQKLEAARARIGASVPDNVHEQIRTPFWSDESVACIHNMLWHIVPAPLPHYFVTCDTPSHFFEGLGVGNQDSEFTFAISRSFALVGEQGQGAGVVFEQTRPQIVKEINRRILSHAERFVFAHRKAVWIDVVAQKKEPILSRIRWR